MSSNIYNLDYYKIGSWLVPKYLRQPKRIILLKAMLSPLWFLLNSFSIYRQAKLYQLSITPQVCYLEKMLNDRYDSTLRRIRIDDAVWHLPWFLYQEDELKPEYFFQESELLPVWLFTDAEAGDAKTDFVVLVPASLLFNSDEMKGLLNAYKLFGTSYTIQLV